MFAKKLAAAAVLSLAVGCARQPAVNFVSEPKPDLGTLRHSVYKLEAVAGWSGTGWISGPGEMMTAGHVCADAGLIEAVSSEGERFLVAPLRMSETPDLCLLSAPGVPGAAFKLAPYMPAYGDTVWYIGAPMGVFGEGKNVAPVARGTYSDGDTVMLAGAPGASGSPVFTTEGVVGVLVAGYRGTHITVLEPLDTLRPFMEE